jgi:hypothetical protein
MPANQSPENVLSPDSNSVTVVNNDTFNAQLTENLMKIKENVSEK